MKIADDIIAAVCKEHGVDITVLCQTSIRTSAVVAARKDAIMKLRAQHFSAQWIANFLKMTGQAVTYYINPNAKAARDRGVAAYQKRQKALHAETSA